MDGDVRRKPFQISAIVVILSSKMTCQVHVDLTLSVKLKVAISLEPAFDQFSKFGWKGGVKEMMHTKARSRGLGRIGGSNTPLGGTDGGATQLDFFQSIHNLVEAHDEMGSVGYEKSIRDLETYARAVNLFRKGLKTDIPFLSRVSSSLKSEGR